MIIIYLHYIYIYITYNNYIFIDKSLLVKEIRDSCIFTSFEYELYLLIIKNLFENNCLVYVQI